MGGHSAWPPPSRPSWGKLGGPDLLRLGDLHAGFTFFPAIPAAIQSCPMLIHVLAYL
jgi:hypothetical protein